MAEPNRPDDYTTRPVSGEGAPARGVRRWLYLGPLVIVLAAVAVAAFYWASRTPDLRPEEQPPRVTGTAGTETPGGHEPQPVPDSTREEVERRGGGPLLELGAALDDPPAAVAGRRIQVRDVDVERVEGPTLFWVRDGDARVAIHTPNASDVQSGQQVDIDGVVERDDSGGVRIRASRVTPSR